ncbi:mitochondrial inner membrane protease subunit 1 [Lycorma delicatula]|uniref:mitochondrial inner membrane protease subunit 1 n=1 Tax=Lycorma delicatula TaxID=130591 RepID=UPI003F517DEA
MNNFRHNAFKLFGFIASVIHYGCVGHCALEYGGNFVLCSGPSMEPTILTNNIIVSEHISPRLRRIKHGDIVISKSPINPTQFICKRVTGLPGDKIYYGYSFCIVPMGHVWLEGDNKNNSSDSRSYGPVPQALIRGRVICRVWPLEDIRMLTDRPY